MRAPCLLLLLLALPVLAVAEPLPVSVTPARVVLGQDESVLLRVTVPPGAPPLRAVASTGQLRPRPAPSPDVAEYQWTPPDIHYPLLVVLAFWTDAPEGPPQVTPVFIPLLGRNTLEVNTIAGAQVTAQVAGTVFGPVRANRKGLARVPVEVPPGVHEASVIVTQKRKQTYRTTPIDSPPPSPLLAIISPEVLPAMGPGWLLVFGEQRLAGAELTLRVRGGSVEEPSAGVFRLTPEPGVRELLVEARRRDGTGTAQVGVSVEVPSSVVVPLPQLALLLKTAPRVPATPPVKVLPPPAAREPGTPSAPHLSVALRAGGFFAGGDNRGPLASVEVSAPLPTLGGRLSVEVEQGVRQAMSHPRVEPLGLLNSRVVAIPLLLAASARLLEVGALSLHGRVGGGALFYNQRTTSPFFDVPLLEQGYAPMGFVAGQASWRLGALSVLLEVRGSYAPVHAPLINAQLGGLSASLGVRYAP